MPHPTKSPIQNAAGLPKIKTLALPLAIGGIGNGGRNAGGGPAIGGWAGPTLVAPVHMTKSPIIAAGIISVNTVTGRPKIGTDIMPLVTSTSWVTVFKSQAPGNINRLPWTVKNYFLVKYKFCSSQILSTKSMPHIAPDAVSRQGASNSTSFFIETVNSNLTKITFNQKYTPLICGYFNVLKNYWRLRCVNSHSPEIFSHILADRPKPLAPEPSSQHPRPRHLFSQNALCKTRRDLGFLGNDAASN